MLCQSEPGVLSGSDFYFYTPSVMAKEQLFYFTSVGHFFCDTGYQIERHVDYGNYMLFLVKEGRMMVSVEGETAAVKEGEMAILNCHKSHKYYAASVAEFLWIHFDGSNTDQFYQDILRRMEGNHVFPLENPKRAEDKLREIISHCRYENFSSEFDDSLHIYELLITIYKDMLGNRQKKMWVGEAVIDDALRYIEDNMRNKMTIEEIARHVGVSESHFSRKFRNAMNSSPKEYIIRRRLNEAKHLLKTTIYTVGEIAFMVGFNSESHFVNTFTSKNGISPKKFREFPI